MDPAGLALVCQVYVWTQQLRSLDRMEEMFRGTREAGFRRVELLSSFLRTPELRERTGALLCEYDLEPAVLYHGGVLHEEPGAAQTLAETLELAGAAQSLGCRRLNFNPSPKPGKALKSDDELRLQAAYLNRLGRELRNRGMRLLVHQHDAEMRAEAREWRFQLRHTDPALVDFCLDLHWVYRGGQDPLALLGEAAGRVQSLHLRNSSGGVWSEALGEGDINYQAVADSLCRIGYRGLLVVELAYEKGTPCTRPLPENLRLSREFAERVIYARLNQALRCDSER
jgi:inosose dehydratase